jgi:HD-GYP domain-containing protein (c-di-GMP phosphodiesterase class II)
MISDRTYRPRLSGDDAVAELRLGAGGQFDPAVVEVFIDVLDGTDAEAPAADSHSSTVAAAHVRALLSQTAV